MTLFVRDAKSALDWLEMEHRHFNVWVTVRPAPDLPGQWVAHCLDFDVMSQGDSVEHALRMIHEATVMVVLDDLNHGRDPHDRRAPEEFFGELFALFERGEKIAVSEIAKAEAESRIVLIAFPFEFHFAREGIASDLVAQSMRPAPMAIASSAC